MFTTFRKNWQIFWVLVIALILRIPLLNGSFWLDEAAQALESARPLSQQLQIVDDFQPPLIHLLVHFEILVSRAEWWLRLGAAVIPGLVTIWGLYALGARLFSKKVGLIAALFLATSSFHIFYSQELRPYSLPAMFGVLSWLVLVEWANAQKSTQKKSLTTVATFAILTLLGLYSSYLYPFFFFAQIIWVFFFQRRLLKNFLLATLAAAIGFVPWLPSFIAQFHAGQDLRVTLPGWQNIVGFDQMKSLLLIYGKFLFGVIHLEASPYFALGSLGLGAIGIAGLYFTFKCKKLSPFWLILIWLLIPLITAWLVSFVVPILQPKRVLFCLPALWLFFAAAANALPKKRHHLQYLAIIFIVFINLFGTYQYYVTPKYQREDWRSLHQEITTKYSKYDSIVVFAFPAPFAPWEWYDDGSYPVVSTGALTIQKNQSLDQLKKVGDYKFVLVFDYLRDLTDPQNRILMELQRYGYKEVDRINPATPLGFVRVYAKPENTLSLR